MKISFVVNGELCFIDVPPMKRLLVVLREDLRLTGSKEGCGASWKIHLNIVNNVCKIQNLCYIQA